jgi:hypothetical protein
LKAPVPRIYQKFIIQKKILHLADINYAKKMVRLIGSVANHRSGAECEIEKSAVIKVFLFSGGCIDFTS